MEIIDVQDAERKFEQLLKWIRAGEEVVIGVAGQPRAVLKAVADTKRKRRARSQKRKLNG
jgi:prevent-host-death family protein